MTDLQNVKFTLALEGKAAAAPTESVVELADGDLLIEGWGSNLDLDRENESFLDGAFSKSIAKFLAGPAPLNYHHKMDVNLGKVIGLEPVEGKGTKLRAIVRHQSETSPLRHIYEGIKSGHIAGLSTGGLFERTMTPDGPKISNVDILEWSVTPVPVGRGTNFSVIAGKAVADLVDDTDELSEVVPEVENPEDEVVVAEPEGDEKPEGEGGSEDDKPEGEDRPDADAPEVDDPETPEDLPLKVTGENIEPGSITAAHLSDDLRSSFTELKPETPSIEAISARLDEVFNRVEGYYAAMETPAEDDTPTA